MTQKHPRTLKLGGVRIPVSEAVYQAYYQERERARYLEKRARNKELSAQALAALGYPLDHHAGPAPSGEACYFKALEAARLEAALAKLAPEARDRLWALVLGESSERAMAKELGLSPATIHRRKVKALKRLREALEDEKP